MAYHDVCRYPSFVPGKAPTFSILWQRFLAVAALCLGVTGSTAQVLQNKKPTEVLIKRYEKMVEDGALLSPEGWKRASAMFERTIDYPVNSDIELISIPGIIGETRRDRNRAQVETKWGDSHLRYRTIAPGGCIMIMESFSLVFVQQVRARRGAAGSQNSGEWKIERAPQTRAAPVAVAIKYVEEMRAKTADPLIRRNAARTIAALKRFSTSCNSASAC
jgi:hypothetical protein